MGRPIRRTRTSPDRQGRGTNQNVNDLKTVDKENQVARIGSNVGGRKRVQILEEAEKLGVKILNAGAKAKPSDFEKLEEEEK